MRLDELLELLQVHDKVIFRLTGEGETEVTTKEVAEAIEDAFEMLLSQAGENDAYLACAVIDHDGMPHVVGEMFDYFMDFMDWLYTERENENGSTKL